MMPPSRPTYNQSFRKAWLTLPELKGWLKPSQREEKKAYCIVMQEASDAHSKTADSDTVSTYQVSSVQLVTDKKLEAFNKA